MENAFADNFFLKDIVFYLKVNRDDDYASYCISFWLSVVRACGSKCIIICDKDDLKDRIIAKFNTDNLDVIFIKSDIEHTQDIVNLIAVPKWKKAAYAHLTTFIDAEKNGYRYFFNIDADDTSFCASKEESVELLKSIVYTARIKNISLFSLDMWWSIRKDIDWTFGITYNDISNVSWLDVARAHYNDTDYVNSKYHINVDSYFDYLRKYYPNKIKSYYIKNIDFVHWGAPFGPLLYKFYTNYVVFPRKPFYLFTKTVRFGKVKENKEIIPIDYCFDKIGKCRGNKKELKQISRLFNKSPLMFSIKKLGFKNLISIFFNRFKGGTK